MIDPKLIKEIRRLSQNYLGVDKFKIKIGNLNFDKNLSKSRLGKSFQEMLDQQLGFLSEDLRSYYNEFITGFSMINFFGLDYEKNKKVKFKNTNNDAQHAFFASAVDMLVSDDTGLLNKSEFLYNFYKIDTKLVSFDEFIEFINQYRSHDHVNEDLFISQLQIYGSTSIIVANPFSVRYNNEKLEMRRLTNKYWKLFDRLLRVRFSDSDEEYFILHPSKARKNNLIFYKEIDYIIKSLNNMLNHNVEEIAELDKKKIKNGDWEGKYWSTIQYNYLLRYDSRIRRLVLQIGPISK